MSVLVEEPVGLVPRAAVRYWLLRNGSDAEELRFTHRASAERWADTLAGQGIATTLTRHDETTPTTPTTPTPAPNH